MGFQAGTATNVNDLLDQLRIFAVAQGWTIDRFIQTDSGGANNGADDMWLQLHSLQGGFHNLISTVENDDVNTSIYPKPWIRGFGATGVNLLSNLFSAQPGSSWSSNGDTNDSVSALGAQEATFTTDALKGPFTGYNFFGNSQYLHCVVEITPGEYAHFGVGTTDKKGTWDGGEYGFGVSWKYTLSEIAADSSNAYDIDHHYFMGYRGTGSSNGRNGCSGYNKIDLNSRTDDWARMETITPTSSRSIVTSNASPINNDRGLYQIQRNCPPNRINGVAPLDPFILTVAVRDEGTYICQQVPDMRFVNIETLTPGQSIFYGSDEFIVFPYKKKGAVVDLQQQGELNSWNMGVAYRKVV